MHFKKPSTILDRYLNKLHELRTGIDNKEHYISSLITYVKARLGRRNREVLILTHDISMNRRGIEVALMNRANLLAKAHSTRVTILTTDFNPRLRDIINYYKESGLLSKSVVVRNMFDDIVGYPTDTKPCSPTNGDICRNMKRYMKFVNSNESNLSRYVSLDGSSSLWRVNHRNTFANEQINYFYHGKKYKKDIYYSCGRIACTLYLSDTGDVKCVHHYATRNDKPSIDYLAPKGVTGLSNLKAVALKKYNGEIVAYHDDIRTLVCEWIESIVDVLGNTGNVAIVCDRYNFYGEALKLLRTRKPQSLGKIIFCIHSHHLTFAGNCLTSRPKAYIQSLLSQSSPFTDIICLTKSQRADLASYNSGEKTIHVIPHPITRNNAKAPVAKRAEHCPPIAVTYLAWYSNEKDHHTAIAIAEEVARRTDKVIFNFYGGGVNIEAYREIVRLKNLDHVVCCHGYADDPIAIYRSSSLSILTSIYEGYSLSILESLASGCPVVSFDIQYGPNELIQNGVNGYLIKNRSIEDFTSSICQLSEDKDLLASLQDGALSSRDHLLTEDKFVDCWQEVFER